MAKHQHQLQWRARPDGGWRFHSAADKETALGQIDKYLLVHGDRRTFDYRIVESDSDEAIEHNPVQQLVISGPFRL